MQLKMWIRANKVLVGGLVALVLIFILVIFALSSSKKTTQNQTTTTSTSTANTTLALHLVRLVEPDKVKDPSIIFIDMDTHGDSITGDQFVLQFDPKVIYLPTLTPVIPSLFFPAPTVLVNHIDTAKGIISFVEIVPKGHTPVIGKGTLAILTFHLAQKTTGSSTNIKFSDGTAVSGLASGYSYLHSVQNVNIPLQK